MKTCKKQRNIQEFHAVLGPVLLKEQDRSNIVHGRTERLKRRLPPSIAQEMII